MSISLQKGQKVNLSKESTGLSTVFVGLGWDKAKKKVKQKGGLFSGNTGAIDCDASAIMLKNGRLTAKEDVVYYGRLNHKSGTVRHMGDNLTGEGDGDDEQIIIKLAEIPKDYDRIVIVVNIYKAFKRHQHFGLIENAFIRIVDTADNREMCRYNLTEDYSGMTAMIFGEVYRHNGEWKFNAVGQGTDDPGLNELIARYK